MVPRHLITGNNCTSTSCGDALHICLCFPPQASFSQSTACLSAARLASKSLRKT